MLSAQARDARGREVAHRPQGARLRLALRGVLAHPGLGPAGGAVSAANGEGRSGAQRRSAALASVSGSISSTSTYLTPSMCTPSQTRLPAHIAGTEIKCQRAVLFSLFTGLWVFFFHGVPIFNH